MSTSQWKNDEDLISDNVTDMNLNPGDIDSGRTVTLDAGSNDIEMGGVVTFDASGDIAHPSSSTDVIVGTVTPESADKDDSKYTVEVFGTIFAAQLDDQSATDVSPGDTLYPSSDYAGAFTGESADGVVNTGDADTDVYTNHPIALESGVGADDNGDLDGDVILAFYR